MAIVVYIWFYKLCMLLEISFHSHFPSIWSHKKQWPSHHKRFAMIKLNTTFLRITTFPNWNWENFVNVKNCKSLTFYWLLLVLQHFSQQMFLVMVPIFLFLIVKNFGFFWLWSVVRTLHCFIFDFWDKMLTYVVTFKTLTKNYLMNLFTGNFIICFNVFHCFTIILLIGSCFASEICFYHMVIIFYVLKDFSKT